MLVVFCSRILVNEPPYGVKRMYTKRIVNRRNKTSIESSLCTPVLKQEKRPHTRRRWGWHSQSVALPCCPAALFFLCFLSCPAFSFSVGFLFSLSSYCCRDSLLSHCPLPSLRRSSRLLSHSPLVFIQTSIQRHFDLIMSQVQSKFPHRHKSRSSTSSCMGNLESH